MQISPPVPEDRAAWEVLARGYRDFYMTPTSDDEFSAAWDRLMAARSILGLAAKIDGELVGIAHYLYHDSVWTPKVCYLQDLFTKPSARGRGVGTALIQAVASRARQHGATRYYWLTQDHNATARAVYDKLAHNKGFIRYDFPLD